MSYSLDAHQSLEANLQRAASSQLEKALVEAKRDGIDDATAVHQVRKRCKKLRGLIRLYRSDFDEYKKVDKQLRKTAKRLSSSRDQQALIETYDLLMDHFGEEVDRTATGLVRRRMTLDLQGDADDPADGDGQDWQRCQQSLEQLRDASQAWAIDETGFHAIKKGLKGRYKKARVGYQDARDKPSPHRLHEWRKQVKYHGYHLRLLREVYPPLYSSPRKAIAELGELLGNIQNLHVFQTALNDRPDHYGDDETVQMLAALAKDVREELTGQALADGKRLFAEKPKHFIRRFKPAWKLWHRADAD
jgi:CHAD domain-containing protein